MITKPGDPAWKLKAQERRKQQIEQIPTEWRLSDIPSPSESKNAVRIVESCGILSDLELKITALSTTAQTILSKLHTRQWSSVQVTTAFCKRAALLQQLTGCLTEILFQSALKRAQELDEILETTGKTVGPLHGLPISVKDNQDVAGVDTTVGWVGLIGKPAAEDTPGVAEFRRLGGVIYVKTNVPQSMMMSDSYNHVFGQSVNSLNRELISGGSSGGEAALIAGGGSIMGTGTDIGGSVRIPACLQGLYGMCPTVGRWPNRESVRSQKYMVPPVAGPLTRHLNSMEIHMRAFFESRPWERDPGILPIPWRQDEVENVAKRKLRIGYVIDDGVILPQPPIQRAVRELVQRLQRAGHDVFEWNASSHKRGYDLWLRGVLADGGKKCADLCKLADEPLIEGMLVGKDKDLLDLPQRMELADEIWDYQREYMKMWADTKVDAVIMPIQQWVGMRPKTWVKSDMYVGYTSLMNLLNWTSLAIPATTVSLDLDQPDAEWKAHQARSFSDQFNHDSYDVDLFNEMPVGLQLMTGRFGEEKAIGIADVIQALST